MTKGCREQRGGRDTGWKWLIRVHSAMGCFLWLVNGPQSWDECRFKKDWGKVTSSLTEMEDLMAFPEVDRSRIFIQQNTWLLVLQTEEVNGFTFIYSDVFLRLVIVKKLKILCISVSSVQSEKLESDIILSV